MNKEALFMQMDVVRSRTLYHLAETTEEQAEIIPSGFKNNIRWNLGHILTVQENIVYKFSGEKLYIPDYYPSIFANKTSPADWASQENIPSLETLRDQLQNQRERIKKDFSERLNDSVPRPIRFGEGRELTKVGDLIAFTFYHEGMHQGFINALQCTIRGNA